MLVKTTLSALIFTFSLGFFLVQYHFHITPTDFDAYLVLKEAKAKRKREKPLQMSPAVQKRYDVRKELWIPENTAFQRKHLLITCKESELQLLEKKGKIETLEQMTDVDCHLFEPLETRHFVATEGTYHYPSQTFEAKDVTFRFFQKDASPYLSGTANQTYFTASNQIATQSEAIHCEGNVRLFSQMKEDAYALADQLIYYPKMRTLHLFSHSPTRVLFWKADGTMQLSAPQIQARYDTHRGSEEVEGIGDVHFAFDVDEKNRIETLFGKYL